MVSIAERYTDAGIRSSNNSLSDVARYRIYEKEIKIDARERIKVGKVIRGAKERISADG